MKISSLMLSAVVGLTMLSAPALAQDASRPGRCFSAGDFNGWKSPDPHTIIIRVGVDRYYRLDLSAPCQALQYPGAHLITKIRGSDQVCDGLDWDLSVSDSSGIGAHDGFKQACIVRSQTPLSAAEVAQIPKKFKP